MTIYRNNLQIFYFFLKEDSEENQGIQQIHLLDKGRYVVVVETPQGPQMRVHQLNKSELKTGNELDEERKKVFKVY